MRTETVLQLETLSRQANVKHLAVKLARSGWERRMACLGGWFGAGGTAVVSG